MKPCNYCNAYFKPKVSYQIYCGENCRAAATKEKLAEKYNAKRRKSRMGKGRRCLGGCNQDLSIYNDSGFCSNCNVSEKEVAKMLKKLKGFIDYEQNN